MWELRRYQNAVINIRHKTLVSLENGHSRAENPALLGREKNHKNSIDKKAP